MEHRSRPRSQIGNPKTKESRVDYYKYPNEDRRQGYPPPDPREWDRTWGHPDSRFRPPVTSPVRGDPLTYGPQHHPYGYGWSEPPRPPSRHGYDYPAYSQWDYREGYGYYKQDYYRGQQQYPDGGQWRQHETWPKEQYQEINTSTGTEERFDQRKGSAQKGDYRETTDRENGDTSSSYYLGTLESSKHSGLSSSSYELSLYINGAEQREPGPPCAPCDAEEQSRQISAPLKYPIPHAVVSFGPAGQLIRVCPGFTPQKNVTQLEIHSMEAILSDTKEQQELRKFPGPLTREDLHKVDAMEFAQQMAGACLRDDKLYDKSSAALLWNLLVLFCRQNGQMVGSDMAELLVQGSRGTGGGRSDSSLIDFSEGAAAEAPPTETEDDLLTGNCSSESAQRSLKTYTLMLLAGRKKDALESAMNNGLWGHALFLASKMDNRSYTTVLNRFTGELTANDPLQTLFQLLSGRVPAASTCCGSEKWGNWRPHLAVILSNDTSDSAVKGRAIATMGDTLASRGLLHSAHVCYLTTGLPFGAFTQKDERLVLLGSSHRQSFKDFAVNSAIQCTELYEYCRSLGGRNFFIPSFQVYKFLYAARLLDCGLCSQAFHYCEVVGQAILQQSTPSPVLTDVLLKLADRLRYAEVNETGLSGADLEPGWMTQLRLPHLSGQTDSYGFGEIRQEHPEQTGDISPVQSPEPELFYCTDTEERSGSDVFTQDASSTNAIGVYEWPQNPLPVTAPVTSALPVPNPDVTCFSTDTVTFSAVTSLSEGVRLSGTSSVTSPVMVPGLQTFSETKQSPAINYETSEHRSPSKQNVQTGRWFSGWFKSKPQDDQHNTSEQTIPPQAFSTPEVSPLSPPAMFQQQCTTSGINPFSSKAGPPYKPIILPLLDLQIHRTRGHGSSYSSPPTSWS